MWLRIGIGERVILSNIRVLSIVYDWRVWGHLYSNWGSLEGLLAPPNWKLREGRN